MKREGKEKWEVKEADHSEVKKKIATAYESDLRKAFKEIDKKKENSLLAEGFSRGGDTSGRRKPAGLRRSW